MNPIDDALSAFLTTPDERARLDAYELGRRALADGVGLMEWVGKVHAAVVNAIRNATTPSQCARVCSVAEGFLLESLSAYEMAFQGVREANDALRRQNDLLEGETRRIAHEIHDTAGQLLVSVYMELQRLAAAGPADAAPCLSQVTALLDQVQSHLRRFAHELRPTILDDLGLLPALEALGQSVSSRTGIAVSVEGNTEGRLLPAIEIALYRTVQEALNNTTKHSRAARAEVRVERRRGEVRCTVTDDGIGFAAGASTDRQRGLGLIGLRERLAPLGGSIRWGSLAQARGAVIVATIPLETSHAASSPRC
jgi:signal transduction histidine kinase